MREEISTIKKKQRYNANKFSDDILKVRITIRTAVVLSLNLNAMQLIILVMHKMDLEEISKKKRTCSNEVMIFKLKCKIIVQRKRTEEKTKIFFLNDDLDANVRQDIEDFNFFNLLMRNRGRSYMFIFFVDLIDLDNSFDSSTNEVVLCLGIK